MPLKRYAVTTSTGGRTITHHLWAFSAEDATERHLRNCRGGTVVINAEESPR